MVKSLHSDEVFLHLMSELSSAGQYEMVYVSEPLESLALDPLVSDIEWYLDFV